MRLLSFDTSSTVVDVCLFEDGNVVGASSETPDRQNRQESAVMLLPAIDALLRRANWEKSSVDGIVAGIGPGSFTGVRVAVVTGRALSQGLGVGLIPVSSLESMATVCPGPCVVLKGAGRLVLFAACYQNKGENLEPIQPPTLVRACDLGSWVDDLKGNPALGPALAGLRVFSAPEALESARASEVPFEPVPDGNLAAGAAGLAFSRLGSDCKRREELLARFPFAAVVPMYIRDPSITVSKARN